MTGSNRCGQLFAIHSIKKYKSKLITGGMVDSLIANVLDSAKQVNDTIAPQSTERNYHNAFELELNHRNIDFISEPKFPNMYRGVEIGYVKPDILLKGSTNSIIVELKTSKDPDKVEDQIKYYMQTYGSVSGGLVICFNDDVEYDLYW